MSDNWLEKLVWIMSELRSEHGCPWDLEQDHQSLKRYLIEESYELFDAIDDADDDAMADELGDVLLQVVFHAQIASETERFDIQTVAEKICRKMIRRHPHVFGDKSVDDAAAVLEQWEEIKRQEKGSAAGRSSVLDGIPKDLPALMKAEKLQKKAAKVGFDWPDSTGVLDKLEEEIAELREAVEKADPDDMKDEMGDLLFAIVNLCRFMELDPEEALRQGNNKFYRRFQTVETEVSNGTGDFSDYSLEELEAFWQLAKSRERS